MSLVATLPKLDSRFVAVLLAILVALGAGTAVNHFVENTAQRVVLRGTFEQDLTATLSSISPLGAEHYLGKIKIKGKPGEQKARSPFLTSPVHRLKMSFAARKSNNPPGESKAFNINRIHVQMPYSLDYYYTGSVVNEFFSSQEYIANTRQLYALNENGVAVLTSTGQIGQPNWGLRLFIGILFFSGFLILFRSIQWSDIPAFKDLTLGHRISSQAEFDAINGVRGLAALLVLFSHTAPGFAAVQMGLALLFVISGFLLAKPFVVNPNAIFSLQKVELYLLKRLKRILPMYYTFVFLSFGLTLEIDAFIRHILFVQGDGHLWPMTQIFAFYMILPLVLLVTCASYRIHRIAPIVLLLASIFTWLNLLIDWKPFFNGRFYNEFFFYAFLIGILGSYIQYDWLARNNNQAKKPTNRAAHTVALVALIFTTLTILWSAPMRPTGLLNFYISQFYVKCFLALGIILFAVNCSHTWFQKIIANPIFRSVGIIGFSFYLLHGVGIEITNAAQLHYLGSASEELRSWSLTIGAFLVTFVLSVFTYSYIERPFFGYRRKPQ